MISRREVLVAATAGMLLPTGQPARRIGFIDDDPDNFHANVYLRILRNELKQRGYVVAGVTALQAERGRAWAKKNGVPYYASVEELAAHVEFFAVLAPSTPATHLKLCQQAFLHGKPTFVDKTFAPSATIARRIFQLADQHNVPVQTSSALRYTNVQDYVLRVGRSNVRHMVAWGGGRSFDEYAVHPVELVISCMGHRVRQLMRRGREPEVQLLLDFDDGRTAVVNVYTRARTPFAAAVTTVQQTRYLAVDTKSLFVRACAAMLDFFDARRPLVDRRETMAIMHILDLARQLQSEHRFVPVPPA